MPWSWSSWPWPWGRPMRPWPWPRGHDLFLGLDGAGLVNITVAYITVVFR